MVAVTGVSMADAKDAIRHARGYVKRNAARTVAICDEALAADGFVP
jgi:hypothetical protein